METKTLTQEALSWRQHNSTNSTNAKERMALLVQAINYHNLMYYERATSDVSDAIYDQLFDYLKELEEVYPQHTSITSPTQTVGYASSDRVFDKVKHPSPMLSLDKAYTHKDLLDWDRRNRKVLEVSNVTYELAPKLDGIAIELIYEDDRLVMALTRGDGHVGDNVTDNTVSVKDVPTHVPAFIYNLPRIVVRGEVLISKSDFATLGKLGLSNARNAASGALRQKDSAKVAERKLSAVIYDVCDIESTPLTDTQEQKQELLRNLGFTTPTHEPIICKNIYEVLNVCESWQSKREQYPYEIDGLVIKVNQAEQQQQLGSTSHHPRWAIALKFDAQRAYTTLEDVVFQVGKTGIVTPVAHLKAINLGGTTITRASLHNEDFMLDKDIHYGDSVLLERAGDVIPYIVSVDKSKRDGTERAVRFPDNCPCCQKPIFRWDDESVWRCDNASCDDQLMGQLIAFTSKKAMNIVGLGEETVKQLYMAGIIKNIPDIYNIDYDSVMNLSGFGERSVEKMKANIERSKRMPLKNLIIGLGIKDIGRTIATALVEQINSIEELYKMSVADLQAIDKVGEKKAQQIFDYFDRGINRDMIARLQSYGVQTWKDEPVKADANSLLEGKTFLFTGRFETMKRSDATKLVKEYGGKVLSGVSKKLNYLVAGEKAGSKLAKAQRISSVKIINEQDFYQLLGIDK